MATVFDVARYFLSRQDGDAGDTISNMKLQKLVYYAQGFTLAITGKPLFMETIEAWEHGPVAPALYRAYNMARAQFHLQTIQLKRLPSLLMQSN